MTIAFLRLTPSDYLTLFLDELPDSHRLKAAEKSDPSFFSNIYVIIQRIALVFAGCVQAGVFTEADCQKALADTFASGYPVICRDTVDIMEALIRGTDTMPVNSWYHPCLALFYVVDYIVSALENYQQKAPRASAEYETFFRRYQRIIQEENLFGTEFYEVIQSGHSRAFQQR